MVLVLGEVAVSQCLVAFIEFVLAVKPGLEKSTRQATMGVRISPVLGLWKLRSYNTTVTIYSIAHVSSARGVSGCEFDCYGQIG